MKNWLVISAVAAVPFLSPAQVKPTQAWTDAEVATFARSYTLGLPTPGYDLARAGRWEYSGIVVQIFRSPNPLQLLNPWAPVAYQPTRSALAVDPITRRPVGVRLFAIHF